MRRPLTTWGSLSTCTRTTRDRLEAAALPFEHPAGVTIATASASAEGVMLLSQGVVRIFHALSPDCQFTVKLVPTPNVLGVVEVTQSSPWVASAEALTPLEGCLIPAPVFREALAMDHSFTTAVLADLAACFERTIRVTRTMGFDGCEQRLIRVLLEYAEHFGRPTEDGLVIRYPLSRQRLALEIGAARRSVDRALAALAARKLLSLSPKGWQVIHAPDELRALLLSPD
ncbi:Crp/Fnr family transcriptional regulator [Archangium lansingense]|uniref:Crp/Fnr family transcriptional regulator n=1 Tax=Archangium lansingense TaxID=2995310 RepID=A0ABT4A4B5_9BACT|nr:Crp/Fnr family transcriptional regulator [Archangium lansinium]MCY1076099.1 Crp/Fnr family transcriptional regulator [Archangium lansinium]